MHSILYGFGGPTWCTVYKIKISIFSHGTDGCGAISDLLFKDNVFYVALWYKTTPGIDSTSNLTLI